METSEFVFIKDNSGGNGSSNKPNITWSIRPKTFTEHLVDEDSDSISDSDDDIIFINRSKKKIARNPKVTDRIRCECGIVYMRKNWPRHQRVAKHRGYMKLKEKILRENNILIK